MAAKSVKVAILMADYGHDPTGFSVDFITEKGQSPVCDKKMLEGLTQKLLGADAAAVKAYHAMTDTKAWQTALSWEAKDLTLSSYDLVFLPGGHDKGVRQLLDSSRAQHLLAEYFPLTQRPNKKYCAAICHGVQSLAQSKYANGQSVLHDVTTTALPSMFESFAYQSTRLLLGDYYKTYGAGTVNVEDFVKKSLDSSEQWKCSVNPGIPFVVEDPKYNYFSGRWPGDAQTLADKLVGLLK